MICPYFGYMRSAGIPTPQLARKVNRMLSRRDSRTRGYSNRVESEGKLMVHANTTTSNLAAADVAKVRSLSKDSSHKYHDCRAIL